MAAASRDLLPQSEAAVPREMEHEMEGVGVSDRLARGPSQAPRRAGVAALAAAGAAAMVCAAGVLAISRASRRAQDAVGADRVSLALSDVPPLGEATLVVQASEGQAFIHLDSVADIEIGNCVYLLGQDEEEVHRVREKYDATNVVEFHKAMVHRQPEGSTVKILPWSDECQQVWEGQEHFEKKRENWPLSYDVPVDANKINLRLTEGCYQIQDGDEIELTSSSGNFEFNMVTSKEILDGDCALHLVYPVKYDHAAGADNLSKMVDMSWAPEPTPGPGLQPEPGETPAPTSPTVPPTPVPTRAGMIPVKFTHFVDGIDFDKLKEDQGFFEAKQSEMQQAIADIVTGGDKDLVSLVLSKGSLKIDATCQTESGQIGDDMKGQLDDQMTDICSGSDWAQFKEEKAEPPSTGGGGVPMWVWISLIVLLLVCCVVGVCCLIKKKKDNNGLPPGWETAVDQETGRQYYYNHSNGISQWEWPNEDAPEEGDRFKKSVLPPRGEGDF